MVSAKQNIVTNTGSNPVLTAKNKSYETKRN